MTGGNAHFFNGCNARFRILLGRQLQFVDCLLRVLNQDFLLRGILPGEHPSLPLGWRRRGLTRRSGRLRGHRAGHNGPGGHRNQIRDHRPAAGSDRHIYRSGAASDPGWFRPCHLHRRRHRVADRRLVRDLDGCPVEPRRHSGHAVQPHQDPPTGATPQRGDQRQPLRVDQEDTLCFEILYWVLHW